MRLEKRHESFAKGFPATYGDFIRGWVELVGCSR
jgi:hypothetical protein